MSSALWIQNNITATFLIRKFTILSCEVRKGERNIPLRETIEDMSADSISLKKLFEN